MRHGGLVVTPGHWLIQWVKKAYVVHSIAFTLIVGTKTTTKAWEHNQINQSVRRRHYSFDVACHFRRSRSDWLLTGHRRHTACLCSHFCSLHPSVFGANQTNLFILLTFAIFSNVYPNTYYTANPQTEPSGFCTIMSSPPGLYLKLSFH